ncbi:TadA family conjugal transfer-associated ATPase [Corynebacterium sp. H127]|uniref:TadA family conjugal transfer-associated ATPase n=1 Tax=Corynebacterium sp. H127 TaxID=3133418 RepID=UPI003098552A
MSIDSGLIDRIHVRLASRPREGGGVNAADVAAIVREEAGVISDLDLLDVLRIVRQESHGAGPLDRILGIPGVTDVLVNGATEVWFDRGEGLELAELTFESEEQVRQLAVRLAVACGRRLDDAQPYADGRLLRDDGTSIRIHAIVPPLSEAGTCISLRVLRQAALRLTQLVDSGTVTVEAAGVLRSVIEQRHSFLVVGGTGSGKTTLLSALLAEVPERERIICIEDTPELRPLHPHVLNLVTRNLNIEGAGAVSMADLLKQALRMRPDRIVLGEIRGAEVVDLLAALNTGHDGGAGTVHANSAREVPARMEALAMLGGLGAEALQRQFSAAVRYIVVMEKSHMGRRVSEIAKVSGFPLQIETIWKSDDQILPLRGASI